MTVSVNGTKKNIEDAEITIIGLLKIEDVTSPDMVSVQLNGNIIKREKFESTLMKENDEVEFLYFMGGGAG
ncbi:MAG: sulfur carrier protein ThiS [Spirochaetales bacterium]|jgi:sulfur carrier protein|nr:sulfur carrier protein ThiS [Spirochaetales bacterium]